MDELQQLIDDGPSGRNGMQRLAMLRYRDILAARRLARTWQEIAASLRIEGRHRALAAAFWRVCRGVEAGRLAVPGSKQKIERPVAPKQSGDQSEIDAVLNKHLIK